MTWQEQLFEFGQLSLIGVLVWRVALLENKFKKAQSLISAETERKQAHTDAFQRLTDEEAIQADMERGARAAEMRAAKRTTLPRENKGPHARVYRPNVRGKKS